MYDIQASHNHPGFGSSSSMCAPGFPQLGPNCPDLSYWISLLHWIKEGKTKAVFKWPKFPTEDINATDTARLSKDSAPVWVGESFHWGSLWIFVAEFLNTWDSCRLILSWDHRCSELSPPLQLWYVATVGAKKRRFTSLRNQSWNGQSKNVKVVHGWIFTSKFFSKTWPEGLK